MADLFLVNGRLQTQDPAFPNATAVAIRDGCIWAVGDDDEIQGLARRASGVLDLEGHCVLPGLHDSHFHFYDWALGLRQVTLADAGSLEELCRRIAERVRATPAGDWILGQGWNETRWPRMRMPTREDLDAVAPDNPVAVWRADLHLLTANTLALKEAGITAATQDPPDGIVDRDAAGEPTGVLRELAMNQLTDVIPPPTEAETVDAMRQAFPLLHRLGVTGVHDYRIMGGADGPPAFRAYQRLQANGQLPLRLWMDLPGERLDEAIALGLQSGFGNDWLRVGHIKLFADGGQGARTAWMLEPYLGSDNCGLPLTPMPEIAAAVERANLAGLSAAIHAIGDRAIRELSDVLQDVDARHPHLTQKRIPNRIEHVQNIRPEDLRALAGLGIVASVQPIHVIDDMIMVEQTVGPRGQFTYAFRNLLDGGVPLTLGSDCPVADPNPMWGIHAAVTRQRRDGTPPDGWYPAQRLTVAEAVWGFTMGPAEASGRSHELGSITPGKLADLIVLDRDILAIEPMDIADVQVVMTVLGGQVVHQRQGSA
jgi:predicted amidohydrolase YtcJ